MKIASIFILAIPRNRKIWIFGSWKGLRFSDNSKYLFLYIANNHPDIRPIWITRSYHVQKEIIRNGYECYLTKDLKGIALSILAKYHIVDHSPDLDIISFTSPGAHCVKLWHGLPIKKIGRYLEPKTLTVDKVIHNIKLRFKSLFC